MLKLDDIQIVLVRSLYDNVQSKEVKDIWGNLIEMKVKGYKAEYPEGILPFDTSDLVATHLVVCNKNDSMKPLFAFKSITLDKCDYHRIPFPMIAMTAGKEQDKHVLAVNSLVNHYRETKKSHMLAYNGSFTCDPDCRKYSNFKDLLWDLTLTLLVKYYTDYNIPHVVAVASKQFRVDRRKLLWGWKYLQHENEVLDALNCYPLFDTLFAPMELKQHSELAINVANKYQNLWDNRVVYEKGISEVKKKVA